MDDCDPGHSDAARVFLGSTAIWFARWWVAMERLLFLWDEIDDLVGTGRYMVKNTAMAIWSSVRHR